MRSLLLVLALTGCAASRAAEPPQWVCDDNGRIIIPDSMPEDRQVEAINRNIDLLELRVRALSGEHWIDPARLVKAKGCP